MTHSGRRRLSLEALESRQMLAVFHVSLSGLDTNTGGAADPFRTIGAGIVAAATANDGADEVRVEAGTYNTAAVDLPVTIPADAELDNLTLSGGWNAAFTLQTGTTTFTPQAAGDAFSVTDDDVTISDITITGASGAGSDGIDAAGGNSLTLVNVISTGHAADGLHASGVAAVSITNSTFSTNGDDGIDVATATTVALSNLSLAGNADDGGVLATIGTVTYTASSGATIDAVSLFATVLERTAPAQQAIAYSAVTTLNINTGDGNDSISISGTAAGTSVNVNLGAGDDAAQIDSTALLGPVGLDGGTQTTEDTFDYNLNATGVTLTATTITAAGSQAVTLANFENQNFDGAAGAIPSITVNHSAAGGTTTLASGATADAGTITPAGGTAYSFFALAAGAAIGVNGSTGDDALAFVNSGATLLSAAVTFAGGAQVTADALSLAGAGNVVPTVVHTATGAATGNISLNLGTLTIAYSGLEPILDTLAATNFTFTTTADTADSIAYENGATLATTHQIRSTAAAFETYEFSGKTNVIVDTSTAAADLADTIAVGFTQAATGLATLQFDTGAGADVVNIRTTQAGTTTTINAGNGADTINVSSDAPTNAGNLNGIAGALTVNGQGAGGDTDTLNISDAGGATANNGVVVTSVDVQNFAGAADNVTITYGTIEALNLTGNANAETFNVRSTAAGTTTTINAGNGADTINVSSDAPTNAGNLNGIAGALTVNGQGAGGDTDTLNISDAGGATANSGVVVTSVDVQNFAGAADNVTITYGTIETLNLTGNANAETFNVRSTAAGTTTTINAGNGADTINVSSDAPTNAGNLNGIAGALTVNGQGAGGDTDTLNISDAGGATANSGVVVTNADVQNFAGAADNVTITYGTIEALNLTGNANAETFNVRSTAAGTTTTINAGNGADTINVSSDAPTNAGNLNGIAGALTVNGQGAGGDTDTLNISDAGGATANSGVVVTSVDVQNFAGAADNVTITYGTIEALNLTGNANAETFNVRSTAAGTTTTINAGAANDVINVGNAANSLDDIAGPVIANGNGNVAAPTASYSVSALGVTVSNTLPIGDVLTINDSGDATANTYTLSANDLVRNAVTLVTFGPATTVETINLSAGTNTDTINVTATPASVNVNINTTAGGDAVNVTTTGATSNVVINGDAATNLIALSNTGAGSVTIVNAGGGADTLTLDNSGAASLVVLNGEAADDALRIRRSGAASITVANAGDGNDTIDLGNPGNSLDEILGVLSIDGQANLATTTTACAGTDAATVVTVGDTINVNDQGEAAGNTYLLSANTLARNGATTIAYFGAETINLNAGTGGDTITVNGPSTANHVTVNANAGVDAINVRSTAAGSATEINGGAGNDFITIGSAANSLSTILGAVCVDGGASDAAPTNSFSVTVGGTTVSNSQPIGDVLLVNDQGNGAGSTYAIDADSLQRTAGSAVIAFAATETLTLNAGTGTDTVNIATTAAAQNVVVNTTGGGDTVNVTTTGASSNLIVNGDSGVNAVTLSNTGAGSVTIVNANGGADTLTLAANGAASLVVLNGEAGTDTINVRTTAAASIAVVNGGDDNDTINVGNVANSLDGILGALYIDGQANGAATTTACAGTPAATVVTIGDTLNVNDQGDASGNVYSVNANAIGRVGAAVIGYFGLETLNLNAGDGVNSITFNNASPNHVAISAAAGADAISIQATPAASATEINAGTGNDFIQLGLAGSLDGILGNVCVKGDANDAAPVATYSATCDGTTASNSLAVGDILFANDAEDTNPATYTVTPNSIQRNDSIIATGIIAFDTTETVTVSAGTGADTINVAAAASINTNINTTAGGDTVNVTSVGAAANLIVNGDAAVNAVNVTVGGTTGTASVTIVNSAGGADTITFGGGGAAALAVANGEDGGDTINLRGSAAGSVSIVNGGAGNDTINVGNAGLLDGVLGAVCIFAGGGDPAPTRTLNSATFTRNAAPVQSTFANSSSPVAIGDTLNLLDGAHATAAAYTIDSTHVARGSGPSIGYNGIESLRLEAGTANDTITVQMPSGAPALPGFTNIDAGGGADDELVVNGTAGSDTIVVGSDGANLAAIQVAGIDCAHINGGDGADTIVANRLTLPAQVQGTQQVAVVVIGGGAGDDNILGSQSVDHITAGADNDLVFSEGGNDLVEGQTGNDEVHGGTANDILFGGDAIDRLFGEDGDDFLFADQNLDGSVVPAPSGVGGEVVDGGNGSNSAVALGADTIANITDLLFTDAGTLDVISWLKANFQTSSTPVYAAAAAKFPVDC